MVLGVASAFCDPLYRRQKGGSLIAKWGRKSGNCRNRDIKMIDHVRQVIGPMLRKIWIWATENVGRVFTTAISLVKLQM